MPDSQANHDPNFRMETDCASALESISAGLRGVLALLEGLSDRSEDCHAAHCLLTMLKAHLDAVVFAQVHCANS